MKRVVTFVVLVILTLFCTQLCLAQDIEEAEALDENGKPDKERRDAVLEGKAVAAAGRTYYVRQTTGNDSNDGLSPKTAWRSVSKLSRAMKAGDIAYVGPGLYREDIKPMNSGTAENRITLIADARGEFTGDPPGVVMLTGAEPADETIFEPYYAPGVFKAHFPDYPVLGVVEMDGAQYRYDRVTEKAEYVKDKMSVEDVVAKFPSSYFYDEKEKVLYIHTSDGKHPYTHEIEIFKRLNGIFMMGKHHVTIIGFTFRHMGDAGINFWKESGDGTAINNISYGSRQGIRVYTATNILVYGNTLFRNENCGVYFAARSTNGIAIGNSAYENIKGIRWGSKSVKGMALDNTLYNNYEAGISIEDTNDVILRRNNMVNNKKFQLLVIQSEFSSEDNCFEKGSLDQLTADFFFTDRYKTLPEYQQAKRKDMSSREGNCGLLPAKVDVHKLHEDTMSYAEKARKMLNESSEKSGQEIKEQ